MFNVGLKKEVDLLIAILGRRIEKLEEPVLGIRYINNSGQSYVTTSKFKEQSELLATLRGENVKLRQELKKQSALLNEVIDYVYSKDEA